MKLGDYLKCEESLTKIMVLLKVSAEPMIW
jgi:hypothetical protein